MRYLRSCASNQNLINHFRNCWLVQIQFITVAKPDLLTELVICDQLDLSLAHIHQTLNYYSQANLKNVKNSHILRELHLP